LFYSSRKVKTETQTGWIELAPLRNKVIVWMMSALKQIKDNFPVNILKRYIQMMGNL